MRKHSIFIGIIVITGAAILIFISFYMNRIRISLDSKYVFVKFENADGLKVKDEVRIRGIKCGFVSNVDLTDDFVCARLTVKKKISIPDNTVVGIHDLAVIGGSKYLMLYPGDGASYNYPQDTLSGQNFDFNFAKIAIIMNDMKTAIENVIPDKESMTELLDSVQASVDNINKLVVNTDKSLKGLTANTGKAIETIGSTTDTLAVIINDIRESMNEYRANDNSLKSMITSDSLHMRLDRNLILLEEILNELRKNRLVKGCL